jgi:hypothetical protein
MIIYVCIHFLVPSFSFVQVPQTSDFQKQCGTTLCLSAESWCEVKDVGMELHLFTSSAAIAAAEKISRWQEAFDLSTWIASEDLQLDIVSHCSVISSSAELAVNIRICVKLCEYM